MKAICIKDVIVNGKTVFTEGVVYEFKEISEGNKVTGYEIKSDYGIGVWDKKEPSLKKHFKKEGDLGFKRVVKKYGVSV